MQTDSKSCALIKPNFNKKNVHFADFSKSSVHVARFSFRIKPELVHKDNLSKQLSAIQKVLKDNKSRYLFFLISLRLILPLMVLGSASTNSTTRGYLYGAVTRFT